MVTTLTHRLIDNWLIQDVITSVQQVYLAGVGASVITVTTGRKWFSALVQRGAEGQAQASHQAEAIIGRFQERFETIQTDTLQKMKTLEKTVQKPVRWRLSRLGIPSRKDVQHLARQVERLQQSLQDRKPMAEMGHTGGEKVSQDYEHMAEMGHIGGKEVRAHELETAEVRAHGLETVEGGRKEHENPRSERQGQSRTKNLNRKQVSPALS